MDEIRAIQWHDGKVRLLDQRQLPNELVLLEISDYRGVANAIRSMSVRGAPAIGIAAAFGIVLSVWHTDDVDRRAFLESANAAMNDLKATRPTAKNLFWALDRMRWVLSRNLSRPLKEIKLALLSEAQSILDDDIERCKRIGRFGAELLPHRCTILTHCNAGALATGGYGTALGIVRAAIEKGKKVKVFADETRPLLQGARLTAFELMEDDIDVTLICDSAAAYVMKKGKVQFVIVGADRITRNGDVANKIGTYGLAVLAKHHNIPFLVAAPLSTCDFEIASGDEIPIEERDQAEVRHVGSALVAPEEVPVYNPAFDVTPHELITAIVTDAGVAQPPFDQSLASMRN